MLGRHPWFWAAIVAVAAWVGVAAPAAAGGYYNLPGSFCQCFGYGNGAGYHACLVLGPSTHRGYCTSSVVRLPYPPQSPCHNCRGANYGSMDGGSWLDEPAALPLIEPAPLPSPAAMRPQILR